jgi:hypothetical protein
MKTAILAWDSMISDRRNLEIVGSEWHEDGPLLPIEFSRTSEDCSRQPLALVLHDHAKRYVPVLWAESACADLRRARENLAARQKEDGDACVGSVQLSRGSRRIDAQLTALGDHTVKHRVLAAIEEWLRVNGFDAAIWNDRAASAEASVAYLKDLDNDGKSAAAKACVQRAPAQIRTEIRERIEGDLRWLPIGARPAPSNEWITTKDDLRLRDWAECRTVVGRLDGTLADLRKLGFSFITGLLTASAFLGVSDGLNAQPRMVALRAGVFVVVMMLIAAVFSLDCYYQALLSGAVERALDLEVKTDPRIRVSKYLSVNATDSKVLYVSGALYLLLLATAVVLGVIAAGGLGLQVWTTGPLSVPARMWGIAWKPSIVVASSALVAWYLLRRSGRVRSIPLPLAVGGPAAMALTISFAWALLGTPRQPPNGAASWVVAAGALVAVYIEGYWLYVTARCGLFRNKPGRKWPEGDKKLP